MKTMLGMGSNAWCILGATCPIYSIQAVWDVLPKAYCYSQRAYLLKL